MRLYHGTDHERAAGIRAHGFARSNLPWSDGRAFFSATRPKRAGFSGSCELQCVVVVELPDEIALDCRYRFANGEFSGDYEVPFEVVNDYRHTFRFERLEDLET